MADAYFAGRGGGHVREWVDEGGGFVGWRGGVGLVDVGSYIYVPRYKHRNEC